MTLLLKIILSLLSLAIYVWIYALLDESKKQEYKLLGNLGRCPSCNYITGVNRLENEILLNPSLVYDQLYRFDRKRYPVGQEREK